MKNKIKSEDTTSRNNIGNIIKKTSEAKILNTNLWYYSSFNLFSGQIHYKVFDKDWYSIIECIGTLDFGEYIILNLKIYTANPIEIPINEVKLESFTNMTLAEKALIQSVIRDAIKEAYEQDNYNKVGVKRK